jgi:hypothetical protein
MRKGVEMESRRTSLLLVVIVHFGNSGDGPMML